MSSHHGGGGGGGGVRRRGGPNVSYINPKGHRGKRRKPIDAVSGIMLHVEGRPHFSDFRNQPPIQPQSSYMRYMTPPAANLHNPVTSLPIYHLRSIIVRDKDKQKGPVYAASWDPTGRRLFASTESGCLVCIQGTPTKTFMAHDSAIKSMTWSSNGNYMLSGSRTGYVNFWARLNIVAAHVVKAHEAEVTSLSFSPGDSKFVSSSDDQAVKIWDFARHQEEAALLGHTWDVKCAKWHPYKSLIASCSKDSTVRLWDPRTHECINTLYGHKSQVFKVAFNPNGHWLVTGGQDALIKLWDLRMGAREVVTLRGHRREISSLAWHPVHETLLASGDKEGALMYWLVDLSDRPQAEVFGHSRDRAVWDLTWHPLGHVLCSAGHDHMAKFWGRSRPGFTFEADANDYEQPSILGGSKPLLASPQVSKGEGVSVKEAAASESLKPTERREVEIPGIGTAPLRDLALLAAVGPSSAVATTEGGGRVFVGVKRQRADEVTGPTPRRERVVVCRRCGQEGHYPQDCSQEDRRRPTADTVCHQCGGHGHFARACPYGRQRPPRR